MVLFVLAIWLILSSTSAVKEYSGPDKMFYEPYDRRIIPGLAQQLLGFHNVAYVYGVYGFTVPCERYNWSVFDARDVPERPCECTAVGRGVYRFDDLGACAMNLIYLTGGEVPDLPWPTHLTPIYARTMCEAPYVPVNGHLVTSTGPGWFILRFRVEKLFLYLQTFRLTYRKLGGKKWVKTQWNTYIFNRRILPRVKPFYPCPPWREYSVFCLIITDHIRVVDVPYQLYEAQLETRGIISPEEFDHFEIVHTRFFFRVYNCDVFTVGKCPSMSEIDNPPLEFVSDKDYDKQEVRWNIKDGGGQRLTDEEKNRKKFVDGSLLPLILFSTVLMLLMALLLFLGVFCCAKRRARNRALYNWYFISSASWPVNYTLRLPPNLPRSEDASVARGEADDVQMHVVSKRPVLGLATKHREGEAGAASAPGGKSRT